MMKPEGVTLAHLLAYMQGAHDAMNPTSLGDGLVLIDSTTGKSHIVKQVVTVNGNVRLLICECDGLEMEKSPYT